MYLPLPNVLGAVEDEAAVVARRHGDSRGWEGTARLLCWPSLVPVQTSPTVVGDPGP